MPVPGDSVGLDPAGKGRQRWTNRWKAALDTYDITFDGRLTAGTEVRTTRSVTPLRLDSTLPASPPASV